MDVDTTMTDASDMGVVSRLLELPGELRNHIYSVIVAGEEAQEIQLRYLRQGRSQAKSSLKARQPSRQFLSLAQTNRLLRAEFGPLYTKARRPVIDISDIAEYLEVFPLPDAALTHTIITTLRAMRRLKTPKTVKAPGVDILPLVREDWSTFPFDVDKHITYRSRAEHDTLHRILKEPRSRRSCHDPVLKVSIAAIYLHRRTHSTPYGGVEEVVTLRLTDTADMKGSKYKLRRFQHFIKSTRILQAFYSRYHGVVECTSGMTKMVARKGQHIIVEQLKDLPDV